ncbi:GCN5-related N-acetyltransferase 7, chloroplastic [Euphorbia lathyris]|uniref:GCN5-related N-acetyltransferase 7, chloroplastic n=1 Tax=Euphorbia lathyris TaxID=212925 RepID=UPI00331333AB
MVAVSSSASSPLPISWLLTSPNCCYYFNSHSLFHQSPSRRFHIRPITASNICTPHEVDKSSLIIAETEAEDQLWAASCLRIRSFHDFQPSTYGVQDHKKYLVEREFEAVKERIAGKRTGFRRVSCINATLPLSQVSNLSDELCAECKFNDNGEERVVVGSLDLNQCLRLPDEITGNKPEGMGADFARAYLSNVCVAKELQRQGLGLELVEKSKTVAKEWGITDLYVHVAVDNAPAKNLYLKSGFIYENDEPTWQARFLDRPRRLLLWLGISTMQDLLQ